MVFHEAPQVLLPQTLLNQALLRERLGKGTWCLLYGKHVILFNLCDNPVKWHLNSCVIDTETAAELCCQSPSQHVAESGLEPRTAELQDSSKLFCRLPNPTLSRDGASIISILDLLP